MDNEDSDQRQSPSGMWQASLDVGDEVFWVDPDESFSSGFYRITDIESESGAIETEDTVVRLLNDEGSHAEVFAHELWQTEPVVIFSRQESTFSDGMGYESGGWWSNEAGWADASSATLFESPGDLAGLMPEDAVWLPERSRYHDRPEAGVEAKPAAGTFGVR
jgi:hypothetical protein